MLINLTCRYCNCSWSKLLNSKKAINDEVCHRCGDCNLKIVDVSTSVIDYYEGSPAFETKIHGFTNDELEIAAYMDFLNNAI